MPYSTGNMSQVNKKANRAAVIVGAGTIIVGVVIIALCVPWWLDYFAARSWSAVNAKIVSVELLESSSGRRRHLASRRVVCEYIYEYAGHRHTGRRVGLEWGGSSGQFHLERYQQLLHHLRQDIPLPAYVNPAEPTQAVLFRTTNVMMYGIPAVGALLVLAGIWCLKRSGQVNARANAAMRAQTPPPFNNDRSE